MCGNNIHSAFLWVVGVRVSCRCNVGVGKLHAILRLCRTRLPVMFFTFLTLEPPKRCLSGVVLQLTTSQKPWREAGPWNGTEISSASIFFNGNTSRIQSVQRVVMEAAVRFLGFWKICNTCFQNILGILIKTPVLLLQRVNNFACLSKICCCHLCLCWHSLQAFDYRKNLCGRTLLPNIHIAQPGKVAPCPAFTTKKQQPEISIGAVQWKTCRHRIPQHCLVSTG